MSQNDMGLFAEWQPRYAEVGLALFPVDLEFRQTPDSEPRKKPLVAHWQRMGICASTNLLERFSDCSAFGFQCGARYGLRITVLDVDTTDERVLCDAIGKHGESNVIVKTANGKFHVWYKHNGERRAIRPWQHLDLPLDVLGGGYVTVPPSRRSDGEFYQFIKGGLGDLDQLPKMRGVDDLFRPISVPKVLPDDFPDRGDDIVHQGRRNDSLFDTLLTIAKTGIDAGELLENAMAINQAYDPPLSDGEVMRVADSVMWYTEHGLNFKSGPPGLIIRYDVHDKLIELNGGDALLLLAIVQRQHFRKWGEFPISYMWVHTKFGWGKRRFQNARDKLLATGVIECTHQGGHGDHDPSLYKWAKLGLQDRKPVKDARVSIRHT